MRISLAARYEKSGGVPDPKAPGLASQPPGIIAAWYAHAGDYGRAIDWLEKSFQVGGGDAGIASHPRWDPVRSDPRFQALIRRLGLPRSEELMSPAAGPPVAKERTR